MLQRIGDCQCVVFLIAWPVAICVAELVDGLSILFCGIRQNSLVMIVEWALLPVHAKLLSAARCIRYFKRSLLFFRLASAVLFLAFSSRFTI